MKADEPSLTSTQMAACVATLERLTDVQNNIVIPMTNDERDEMHALLRWLRWMMHR